MAYNTKLAERIRTYLDGVREVQIEEKEMFNGLAFLVNGKMCINVSEDEIMCRFDPERDDEVAERRGFQPMIMRGKQLRGYCYVSEDGYKSKEDFEYWTTLCLEFNDKAKKSKKKKPATRKSK